MREIIAAILMTWGLWTYPMRQPVMASYYGINDGYGGLMTAMGRPMDPYSMTMASPGRPLGSWQLVYNPKTGLYALGAVVDRGPVIQGRMLDLSWEMARAIRMLDAGVEELRIRQVDAISLSIIYGTEVIR